MNSKNKKWIIISVISAIVIAVGIFAFNIIVDKIFSKVTGGLLNSELLVEEISEAYSIMRKHLTPDQSEQRLGSIRKKLIKRVAA